MKNDNRLFWLSVSLLGFLAITGLAACCCLQFLNTDYVMHCGKAELVEKCKTLQAPLVDSGQYIVYFTDPNNISSEPESDILGRQIIRTLTEKGDEILKICPCNPPMVLMQVPESDTIDPVERTAEARDEVEQSGDGARFAMNLKIFLDTTDNAILTLQEKFPDRESDGNTLTIAVIDGGINKELFPNEMWINFPEYDMPAGPSRLDGLDNNTPLNRYADDIYGYDFVEDAPVGVGASPIFIHGTKVAGILQKTHEVILGNWPNLYTPQLMDLKVFNDRGEGTLFDAACAGFYAIDNGADVINASWVYYSSKKDSLFEQVVQRAAGEEIIIVAAAGNDSINTDCCRSYPSAFAELYPNVISVAALNSGKTDLASFSNYGCKTVTLAAPGENVTSIDFEGAEVFVEGTSYAAPFLSALAGALRAKDRNATAETIIDYIGSQAIPLHAPLITKGKIDEGNLQSSINGFP